ncbi:hypothetical protein M378DRAFT_163743 [Amanita muscaria Koide BX008]|uniref:Uncharacterized protein n=1 Tax=Amanita muscaria (strain Koide BX008) TaxID=946122 RepID=A0A0C2WQV8_AMAMK|nr:hypothetical protein M378DRAFT_163743 [Amanita muscaria Koide BX008]
MDIAEDAGATDLIGIVKLSCIHLSAHFMYPRAESLTNYVDDQAMLKYDETRHKLRS